jgi:hypothetical protein
LLIVLFEFYHKKNYMKKISVVLIFAMVIIIMNSCSGPSADTAKPADSTGTKATGPDSAANNGIIPPSASPGNANNSSLADTTYHADSTKRK